MSYTVCHNPDCSLHFETFGHSDTPCLYLHRRGDEGPAEINRYLYRSLKSLKDGVAEHEDFYLCDTCHSAVEFAKNPEKFRAKRAKT